MTNVHKIFPFTGIYLNMFRWMGPDDFEMAEIGKCPNDWDLIFFRWLK